MERKEQKKQTVPVELKCWETENFRTTMIIK